MTTETIITLAVGGAIGFFFSLVASAIAFGFQLYRDHQDRDWQRKKVEQEEGKRILSGRLDALENDIGEMMLHIQWAHSALESIFLGHPDLEALKEFKHEYYRRIRPGQLHLITGFFYFKDDPLHDALHAAIELSTEYLTLYDKIMAYQKSEGSEPAQQLRDQLSSLDYGFADTFARVWTRIDAVRGGAIEELAQIKKLDEVTAELEKWRKSRAEADQPEAGRESDVAKRT